MLSWRSQDHIQLVRMCNPQWLRVYEFMLVACRRFINNLVNSRTEWWTQKCAKWTLAPYVFVLLLMGMRHVPVCGIIAWLYVYALYLYDCMCMMVWQCAHDVMMTSTRSYTVSSSVSSNMIAFVSIHVGWDTWWGSGRFRCRYLVKVPEVSAADTCCGSGRFRCRHLVSFWRVPVQIPVVVPGPGSFTIVQHHCMLVCVWLYLYDCMCMIVWQCAHDVIVKVTRLLELVTAYSPTWLPMYEFTCLMTTMQGLMVAFSSLKSGSSLFLIPQLAAGDVPFWNGAVKKWNKAETSKLLGIAPGLIFKQVCYARRNVFEHQMVPVGSNGSNSSFWACPKNGIRMDT